MATSEAVRGGRQSAVGGRFSSSRTELLMLAAITALAAVLRLYRLAELPPGDGHDVAQYGVDALHILAGARPVFLESNFGREPLFSYLVALVYRFTGPGAFGIHLASALVGIATVPAVWLAARALFAPARRGALAWLPLLAAFLAAVSYWHLNWSRVGLRVILVPLFAALLVAALWRGFDTAEEPRPRRLSRSDGWFLLAGALLGLSLYTYQSARLLPLLAAVAFVLRARQRRRWTRADTAAALLVAAAAAVVFLPLGVYARQHPGALSQRIQQATVLQPDLPPGAQLRGLAQQALTAVLTYSLRGDSDPQFTIPGRPSLNPFLSLGFVIGIAVALWRFRRSPYLFLLAWLALMTAPAMVADQASTAKRYLGAFPAAMMLVALGLLVVVEWLGRRGAGAQGSGGAGEPAGGGAGERGSGGEESVARGARLSTSEDADFAVSHLSASEDADSAVTGRPASEDADSASTGHDAPRSPLLPRAPAPPRPLLPRSPAPLLLLLAGLTYTAVTAWRDYFVVWAADPDLPAHFQADYRAIGQYIATLDREQPVWLSPHAADHPVIQLHAGLRPDLRAYNGRFCLPYTDPVGQRGAAYVIVPGLQDSSLALLQAMYPTGETIDGPLRPGSDRPYYHAFHVPAGATPALGPAVSLPITWAEGISLLGYTLAGTAAPGETLAVTLFYEATATPSANYTAFVHMLGPARADGSALWAQSDSEPCGGALPTGQWRPGDLVRDTVTLTIPADAPPGDYMLATGFYAWPDLTRLPLSGGGDAASLATLRLATP